MAIYTFRCRDHPEGDVELSRSMRDESPGPSCQTCGSEMLRVPQCFTGLFKFEGSSRVSTNSLTPKQRKMAPWFGGPERTEDREIRLEYQKQQNTEEAVEREMARDGVSGPVSDLPLADGAEFS